MALPAGADLAGERRAGVPPRSVYGNGNARTGLPAVPRRPPRRRHKETPESSAASRASPRDLLHRRPSRDHLRPARDRHRRGAPSAHLSRLPGRDGRNRPPPHTRWTAAGTATTRPKPARRSRTRRVNCLPHRSRRDHHLRRRRLSSRRARPRTARRPVEPAAPGATAGHPARPRTALTLRITLPGHRRPRALHPRTPKSLISTALGYVWRWDLTAAGTPIMSPYVPCAQ